MADKIAWSAQYKHPQWQRKRLEAMEAADFECQSCGDKETTLNVHHKRYVKGRMIWEYGLDELDVLCEPCHELAHDDKEVLLRVLMDGGISSTRQAAGLVAGYLDAQCSLTPAVADMAREGNDLYYELGVVAYCAEWIGVDGWRNIVRQILKDKPLTPTLLSLLEQWDREKG